ncbi:hypothetical protein [Engelhardtia mirabilis]
MSPIARIPRPRRALLVAGLTPLLVLFACSDPEPDAPSGPAAGTAPTVNITPADLEPQDAIQRMRFENTLGQAYGASPPTDDLLALAADLGRSARVIDGSVALTPDRRATTAQVLLPEVGLQASLTADPRSLEIYLVQAANSSDATFAHRSLRIGVTVDGNGQVESGHVTVLHHFDLSNPAVLEKFGDLTYAVGWAITGSTSRGLRADPTLARREVGPDGEPTLMVGPEASGAFTAPGRPTATVRPGDKNLTAWSSWAALHARLAGR